jgi:hypothetical protein
MCNKSIKKTAEGTKYWNPQWHILLLWNQQEMNPRILQLENEFYSVTLWPLWELSYNTSQMQAIVKQRTVHYKKVYQNSIF